MGRRLRQVWAAVAVLALAGCYVDVDVPELDGHDLHIRGSGVLVTDARALGAFHGIVAWGSFSLTVEPADHDTIRITTDDNILPHFEVTVRGGVLRLGPAPRTDLTPTRHIDVYVGVRDLQSVEASGAVSIVARLERRPFTSVTLSGASTLSATGAADRLSLALSGASRFEGRTLDADRVEVDISGASAAVIRVTRSLVVWASGVSSVRYLGSPSVEAHVSGLAVVEPY